MHQHVSLPFSFEHVVFLSFPLQSGMTPEQIGGDLIALARMGGSEDDVTTIVVRAHFNES